MDSARADEAAQAAKAGSALALDLVLALAVALAAVLVALLALAFAVARWWAGRARAFGLALVWATAAVEPGPWALSGPWNHLSALCIAAKFTGGMGMCLGDGCTRYTVPGTLVLTHVHAHALCHTRCLLGTMTRQSQDGSGGRGSNKQQASKQINK